MLAPLTKLLPWSQHPPLQDQERIADLIHDLDRAQDFLDETARHVDLARHRYEHALQRMQMAAQERTRAGNLLKATPAGAAIWRRWTRYHRWGRHHHDSVFRITT